ncbi:stage V sporulation protein S [Streptomyces sp. NPDC057445]|uniref:stage V sporulation protein S n=1 Tax=Streptomyces sp. NPDC057445 TaxID=3346136 RepID=UPI0036ABF0AB
MLSPRRSSASSRQRLRRNWAPSLRHAVKSRNQVVLKAVGAGAINQAVKAIPIAQSFDSSFGTKLVKEITFSGARLLRARSSAARFAPWAHEIPAENSGNLNSLHQASSILTRTPLTF